MRCLLRQVSSPPGGQLLHQSLHHRYEERSITGLISIDECSETVIRIVDDRPLTYIVVDALDECDRENRWELINAFEHILQDSSSLVKIFVTSRDDQDLVLAMNNYPEVRIEATDNQDDISHYVSHSVDQLIREKKMLPTQGVPDKLRAQIKQRLCEGAQGM